MTKLRNKFFVRCFCFLVSAGGHALLLFFVFAGFPALGVQEEKIAPKNETFVSVFVLSKPKIEEQEQTQTQEQKPEAAPIAQSEPAKTEPPQKTEPPVKNTRDRPKQPKPQPVPQKEPQNAPNKNAETSNFAAANNSELLAQPPAVAVRNANSAPVTSIDNVKVISRLKPVYPQIARKRGEEGTVVLLAKVESGRVVNVLVEKSSGIKTLDASALSAVQNWKFSAETSALVRVPVSFSLKE